MCSQGVPYVPTTKPLLHRAAGLLGSLQWYQGYGIFRDQDTLLVVCITTSLACVRKCLFFIFYFILQTPKNLRIWNLPTKILKMMLNRLLESLASVSNTFWDWLYKTLKCLKIMK